MLHLTLTAPEADLLREIAEEWRSDLRMEIAATDRASYREALKWKESLLLDIMERLRARPSRRSGPLGRRPERV